MAEWDLIVIGGGPGGYVAALRAAQLGQKVLLVEQEELGGVCMNWGCIPTKFLLHHTGLVSQIQHNEFLEISGGEIRLDWTKLQAGRRKIISQLVKGVEFLLKRHKIEIVKGKARLTSALEVKVDLNTGGNEIFKAEHILLATGSRPAELPFLKADGKRVLTSRQLLEIDQPPQKLVILGAGAIGLEMGTIFQRLGVEVTILELLPGILPGAEETLTRRLERILKRQGMNILTEMKVEKAKTGSQGVVLEGYCARTNQSFREEGQVVLLAIGRRPNLDVLGEAREKFKLTSSGFLQVDEKFRTNAAGVWAIGDLIGGKLLAHKASHQGIAVVENIAGKSADFQEELVPLAVFTEPELASVGLTEKEIKGLQIDYSVGQFHLRASGRAVTMGETEGLVKILVDKQGYLRGAHLLAPHASEMIPELVLAMKARIPALQIGEAVHIHPTLAEAIMEAALNSAGRAIHTLND